MSLGTRLFVFICPALLPPNDDTDDEYYKTLGLTSRSASLDDIRRAYRSKSLDLHPDRLAYRRQDNTEAVAEEYKRVQEAYAILSDPTQRQLYAVAGYSPARYRFLSTGNAHNPVALLENLTKASVGDKTRLVLLVLVALVLLLLQPILIASKVNAVVKCSVEDDCNGSIVDTKWVLVLLPLWIMHGLVILFMVALVFSVKKARTAIVLGLVEQMAWFAGYLVLALAWDSDDDVEWFRVSIPFYLAVFLRSVGAYATLLYLKGQQEKMASPEFVQHAEGSQLHDMTEEQLITLSEKYVIVTVDEILVATEVAVRTAVYESENNNRGVDDEELEAIKVATSHEYHQHEEMIGQKRSTAFSNIIFGFTFISLVSARVEDNIDVSWWIVFLPILAPLALQCLLVCCHSLCLPFVQLAEEAELEEMAVQTEEEEEDDEQNVDDEKEDDEERKASTKDKADEVAKTDNVNKEPDDENGNDDLPVRVEDEDANGDIAEQKVVVGSIEPLETTNVSSVPASSPDQTQSNGNDASSAEQSSAQEPHKENQTTATSAPEDSGDREPELDFDEENFREWYSAHRDAEEHAMEERAKAQSSCCWSTFKLIILCLVIGKLEHDFENDSEDAGYNAFWILFPVFAVMGVILCCCSCLIYGAGASVLESLNENSGQTDDESPSSTPAEGAADSNADPIIVPQPPESGAVETPSPHEEDPAKSSQDVPDERNSSPATETEGATVEHTDMHDLD